MCSACGTGLAKAPWETEIVGRAREGRQRLLAAAVARFQPRRVDIRLDQSGPGYVVQGLTGGMRVAGSLDELVDALAESGESARLRDDATIGDEVAEALVELAANRRTSDSAVRVIENGTVHSLHVKGGAVRVVTVESSA